MTRWFCYVNIRVSISDVKYSGYIQVFEYSSNTVTLTICATEHTRISSYQNYFTSHIRGSVPEFRNKLNNEMLYLVLGQEF